LVGKVVTFLLPSDPSQWLLSQGWGLKGYSLWGVSGLTTKWDIEDPMQSPAV